MVSLACPVAAQAALKPRSPPRRGKTGLRGWGMALLVLALLGYAHQAVVRSLTGPLHRHAPVPQAEPWAWDAALAAAVKALHGHGHGHRAGAPTHRRAGHAEHGLQGHHDHHHHQGPQRHHHGAADAPPVMLEAPLTDALAQAAAGSASLTWLGTQPDCRVVRPPFQCTPWPRVPAAGWTDAPGRLPDRPPRAWPTPHTT